MMEMAGTAFLCAPATSTDYAGGANEGSEQATNAAAVLAMYSTTDDTEANKRTASVIQITSIVRRGDMDLDTALRLLNDVAPEASVSERKEAADRLLSISSEGEGDGELSPDQSMQVANELTRLMTGHGIDADQRVEAAREMVRLSQAGELNVDNASKLMDTIAPEWSVTERKEALGYLAWQFSHGEWDTDSTQRTAEEGYTLITGGEIQLERRMEAGVELVGEGLKQYGGDGFDDENVDKSTALIKGAISGGLSTESVSQILDLDNGKSKGSTSANYHSDFYAEGLEAWENFGHGRMPRNGPPPKRAQAYARAYASAKAAGHYSEYADDYARRRVDWEKSSKWSHAYAEAEEKRLAVYARGLSSGDYADMVERGISKDFAYYFFKGAHKGYNLVEVTMSEGFAKYFAEQSVAGRTVDYAYAYARAKYRDAKSEECAHIYAENYAEQREDGKTREYAHAYAEQIEDGKTPRHAQTYAEQIEGGKTPRHASAYIKQIEDGKTPRYAQTHAEQIDAAKSEKYARAYTEQRIAGKSPIYSNIYAWGVEGRVGGLPILIIVAAIVATMLAAGAGAYVVHRRR